MKRRTYNRISSLLLGSSIVLFAVSCGNSTTQPQESVTAEESLIGSVTIETAAVPPEDTTEANFTETAQAPDYTITRTNGSIDWESVPTLAIDQVLWGEDVGIRAEGQFCYDPEHLYVHLRAVEEEIRAENTEPLSPVYQDSCLEFFFMPEGTDKYFNIEINPNGCVCMQYGPSRTERFSLVKEDITEYFDIRTDRTEDGWEVFYQIPLDYFRYFLPEYEFSGILWANAYKCGDKTANKHYLSWNPIALESPNFHCPEYFGTMVFAE